MQPFSEWKKITYCVTLFFFFTFSQTPFFFLLYQWSLGVLVVFVGFFFFLNFSPPDLFHTIASFVFSKLIFYPQTITHFHFLLNLFFFSFYWVYWVEVSEKSLLNFSGFGICSIVQTPFPPNVFATLVLPFHSILIFWSSHLLSSLLYLF